jgi:integrase/recombinase XerD
MNLTELECRLAAYIAVRQAMGYAMRAERTLLVDFVRFLAERDALNPIQAQMAFDWATQTSGQRGVAGTATRLSMARRFLLHVRATYPDTEIPPLHLVATARRPTPYLFTEAEVTRLIEASRQVGPRDSLRPYTLTTLITLLDSTGLRVGEAVHLSIDDVVLAAPPRLLIRETKFGKSRLVPLHPTMATMLAQYVGERKLLDYDGLSDSFFVSERGTALRVSSLGRWFGQLVLRVGLWPEKGKRWPCLRSFRHTFAVRRLRTWYEEGADLTTLLPHLSVYLGHVSPEETYWYLTATPELLGIAAERFRSYVYKGGDR